MKVHSERSKNIIGAAVALAVIISAAFFDLTGKKADSFALPVLSLAKANLQFEIFEDGNYDIAKNLAGYNYTKEVVIRVPVAVKASAFEWNVSSTTQGRIFSQTYTTHLPELSDVELQVPSVYSVKVRYKNETEQWSDWSEVAAMRVVLASPRLSVEQNHSTANLTQLAKKLFDQRHVASVAEEDETSRKSPTMMRAPIEEIKASKVRNVSLYSGIGTNYLKFDQSDSSGLESGKFSSVTSPTLMVEAGMQWDENWHYGASFHQMPGSIMNNPSTTINQTDYKWSYLGLEVERKISDNIFGTKLSIMGGVQRHEMPFLIGGTNTDVELIQTQLTTGALGFHAEWSPQERWLFEAFMRYQVPLMSGGGNGGVFHVTGGMSYDGLVGISRRIFDNWKVGVYWFGQSHDLNYTYKSDDGSNDRDGKQILFNSDLQVRFGYAWYFGQMIFVFRRRRQEDESDS